MTAVLRSHIEEALHSGRILSEFTLSQDATALHLVARRDALDDSRELLVAVAADTEATPHIVLHFTEKMEDDANEGLHALLAWAWNLLRHLKRWVPDLNFDGEHGVFIPVRRGLNEASSEIWMFALD